MHTERHPVKRPQLFALGLVLAGATTAASAQAVDTQARAWAASCAACHGTQGRASGAIPTLASTDRAVLLQKLLAYKRGETPATVMGQHAKGYTEAELERLATFFANQPR